MSLDLKHGKIDMTHGSGGRASHELISELFAPAFDPEGKVLGDDYGLVTGQHERLVMATDSHVISPLFFPGGNIGSLAVHGTVNDISMSGARPLSLSVGFILEEGFPLSELKDIVSSMAAAARECGVSIITGDTKVVEKGHGDGVYINTTGLGSLAANISLSPANIQKGDKIILSGTLGDHGTCIQLAREHLGFQSNLVSDSQGLQDLVADMLNVAPNIRCMRDPTRGGLAAVLNEWSQSQQLWLEIDEAALPVKPDVSAVCELLGLDPINIANEGKLVAVCPADQADALLRRMKAHPKAPDAAIIGEVKSCDESCVDMRTAVGGTRIIDWPWSDPLPRIC